MNDCLFCKIVNKEIPGDIVYENQRILAFRDIIPQAPTHILIIPKKHIKTINDISEDEQVILGEIVHRAAKLAWEEGIADSGYRTVFNCNEDGGQSVYHIHLHLLGGRPMNWPPG